MSGIAGRVGKIRLVHGLFFVPFVIFCSDEGLNKRSQRTRRPELSSAESDGSGLRVTVLVAAAASATSNLRWPRRFLACARGFSSKH
jgi:hypothetical protein